MSRDVCRSRCVCRRIELRRLKGGRNHRTGLRCGSYSYICGLGLRSGSYLVSRSECRLRTGSICRWSVCRRIELHRLRGGTCTRRLGLRSRSDLMSRSERRLGTGSICRSRCACRKIDLRRLRGGRNHRTGLKCGTRTRRLGLRSRSDLVSRSERRLRTGSICRSRSVSRRSLILRWLRGGTYTRGLRLRSGSDLVSRDVRRLRNRRRSCA